PLLLTFVWIAIPSLLTARLRQPARHIQAALVRAAAEAPPKDQPKILERAIRFRALILDLEGERERVRVLGGESSHSPALGCRAVPALLPSARCRTLDCRSSRYGRAGGERTHRGIAPTWLGLAGRDSPGDGKRTPSGPALSGGDTAPAF